MPHLQFELNFEISDEEKIDFSEAVKQHFATIMDTGTDHIGVTLRTYPTHSLAFGRATSPRDGIVFVNADIRQGRTGDQKRRLSLAFMQSLQQFFNVPQQNIYVILTEHPGEHFQLHDRVLAGWSEGEDPLA